MIGKQPTQEPDTYGVDDGDGECQTTTGNYVLNLFSHSSLFTGPLRCHDGSICR